MTPGYGKIGPIWQTDLFAGEAEVDTVTNTDGDIRTLEEIAADFKAGKLAVYRLAQNGNIPALNLGGMVLSSFRARYLDSRKHQKKKNYN